MSGNAVPYRYITGLPPQAQKEIERNFLEIQKQLGGAVTTIYDAIIDAANPTNGAAHRYKNLSDLMVGENANIVATRTFQVGVIAHGATNPIVETSNITLGGPMAISTIGTPGSNFMLYDYGNLQVWDFAGFHITGSGNPALYLEGLWVQSSAGTIQPFTSIATLYLRNSVISATPGPNFNSAGRTIVGVGCNFVVAHDCAFYDMGGLGVIASYAFGCTFYMGYNGTIPDASITFNQECFLIACSTKQYNSVHAGITLSGTAGIRYVQLANSIQNIGGGSGGLNGQTITISATCPSYVDIQGSSVVQPCWNLVVQAGAANVTARGNGYQSVTVNGNTNGSERDIEFTGESNSQTAIDFTGPGHIKGHVRSGFGSNAHVILRGQGIRGDFWIKGSGNPFISLIGCTDSIITADLAPPAAGGSQAYTIDAASARCVLVLNNQHANFTVASTNAGTNCLVVNELGVAPSGAAGGSLAGTFPNPTFSGRDSSVDKINQDMLPALLGGDAGSQGMQQIPPATGGSPSGAAGGSLNGSYPNPTFAGRDASVDELNKDMTQVFLGWGG